MWLPAPRGRRGSVRPPPEGLINGGRFQPPVGTRGRRTAHARESHSSCVAHDVGPERWQGRRNGISAVNSCMGYRSCQCPIHTFSVERKDIFLAAACRSRRRRRGRGFDDVTGGWGPPRHLWGRLDGATAREPQAFLPLGRRTVLEWYACT